MTLQLTTFEQAKALKDAGFDWEVPDYFHVEDDVTETSEYDNYNSDEYTISRPTVALALKWLREAKGVHVFIGMDRDDDKVVWYVVTQKNIAAPNSVVITTHIKHVTDGDVYFSPIQYFDTHYLAESAGLDKGLKMIV